MRVWVYGLIAAAVALAVIIIIERARAEDHGQYATVPAATRACFKAKFNQVGGECCDGADATRVEDPDWGQDSKSGFYWFMWEGKRIDVPHTALTTGTPCVGYTVVWFYHGGLRCFMPGSRS